MRALLVIIACAGCGMALAKDDGNPEPSNAWPWVCPDGSTPRASTTPSDDTASGTCGPGGALSLSVDGCVVSADWSVLGLSNVQTVAPGSDPSLSGFSVSGNSDLGSALTCTAVATATGELSFSCNDATQVVCTSTLAPNAQPR